MVFKPSGPTIERGYQDAFWTAAASIVLSGLVILVKFNGENPALRFAAEEVATSVDSKKVVAATEFGQLPPLQVQIDEHDGLNQEKVDGRHSIDITDSCRL